MATLIPHLDLRLVACEVEVWLNDIPLLRASADADPQLRTLPVAEFVVRGDNTLTVVPQPGATPGSSRRPSGQAAAPGARFEAKLVLYPEGEFPGSGGGQDLVVLAGGGPVPMPTQPVSTSRALPVNLAPWAWQRASVMRPTPELDAAVGRAVQAAHAAFAARQAEFFLQFGQPYFSEYARAYPAIGEAQRAQRLRDAWVRLGAAGDWRVAPLVPEEFDFRLCAEGRLLELVDKQFRPVLRGESRPYPFPMFLGLLDGRLQMLR
jgi:hypothetical protein